MSFVRFLRWVRGTVSFRVEGKFAERFLNLLSRSGIPVFQTRYTKEFVDQNDTFVLTFLKDGHRDALSLLGSKSGRDMDKMHDSGLTSIFVDGQPTFEEAELVLVCRKRCKSEIAPEDILQQETLDKWYGDRDYHAMYIGEIVAAYKG